MKRFRDVITRWRSAEELADDIGETGLLVRAWKARDNIPPPHWPKIAQAAEKRGFKDITIPFLADLAMRREIKGRKPKADAAA